MNAKQRPICDRIDVVFSCLRTERVIAVAKGRGKTMPGIMVPSTLSRDDFARAYELLDLPALDFDCGQLCDRLCCQEYEPGVGMYLLPGEDCMFAGDEDWLDWRLQPATAEEFPREWKGMVHFVICQGTCPREKRPIQCRTFPLIPYLDRDGNLSVRLDSLAGPLVCPLVREPLIHPVRPEFSQAVLSAWRILLKDPLIRADIQMQSRKYDRDAKAPWLKLLVKR